MCWWGEGFAGTCADGGGERGGACRNTGETPVLRESQTTGLDARPHGKIHGRDAHATRNKHMGGTPMLCGTAKATGMTGGFLELPWGSPRSRDRVIANEEIPSLFSKTP
jgi:hypothetical protein